MFDANDLELMAKERPDECFLKGSGVLKLIGAVRYLEAEVKARSAPATGEWRLVPAEPTPAMIAAAAIAVLPNASAADFELARSAARLVMAHPNTPPGAPLEGIAAAMGTIIPAHRAMLAAAPAAPPGVSVAALSDAAAQNCNNAVGIDRADGSAQHG